MCHQPPVAWEGAGCYGEVGYGEEWVSVEYGLASYVEARRSYRATSKRSVTSIGEIRVTCFNLEEAILSEQRLLQTGNMTYHNFIHPSVSSALYLRGSRIPCGQRVQANERTRVSLYGDQDNKPVSAIT